MLFILPLFTYLWLPQKTICNKKGVWNLVEFKNVKTRNKSQHCFGVWALGVSRILLVFLFGFCFVYFFVFVFTDLVSNAHIKTENWQNSITGVPVRKLKLTDEWKVKGHKTGKFWRKEEKKNQTKLLIHYTFTGACLVVLGNWFLSNLYESWSMLWPENPYSFYHTMDKIIQVSNLTHLWITYLTLTPFSLQGLGRLWAFH